MESQKVVNLLEYSDDDNRLGFQTKKWYIINDQNNSQYGKGNENDSTIKFITETVKSFLVDYSDAYILVTGDIKIVGGNANTNIAFKNCHPFIRSVIHLNDEQWVVCTVLFSTVTIMLIPQNLYTIIKDQSKIEM